MFTRYFNKTVIVIGMILTITLLFSSILFADISRDDLQNKVVTLSMEDGNVVDILKLLAAQNEFNLSISSDVQGTITITLTDVSLSVALDVISSAVNANWYISGNVVVVKRKGKVDLQELDTKLFQLQYIAALEAKTMIAPLLPEGSKIEMLSHKGAGNSSGWDEILEVITFPVVMEKIDKMILEIDQPRPLVEIEVKIIETDVRDDTKLGIDFPDNLSLSVGDIETSSDVVGFATVPLANGKMSWGRMTAGEVTFLIDWLVKEGRSTLVSNPRVTTLSNRTAEIDVTTTIPVETLNRFSEAGVVQDIVSFQDLDVSINLQVTPRVNRDSTIIMDIIAKVEEITGFTGPADNQRPITSRRSVNSSVTVKAGETLALGGLMKEVEHKTITKIPLLGSIPYIGRLFQHHKTSMEKTDLLILITPRLVSSSSK